MHKTTLTGALAIVVATAFSGVYAQTVSEEEIKTTTGQPSASEPQGGGDRNELQNPQDPAADKDSRVNQAQPSAQSQQSGAPASAQRPSANDSADGKSGSKAR